MLHLRLIVPSKCTERAIERLYEHESVTNVVVLPDAAQKPPGDVVLCDVALEDASIVLRAMEELGVARVGSIAVERLEASISTAAKAAESAADGSPSDAVVWEAVEEQTSSSAELTLGYLLLVTIATAIAAVGILTDSVVLIIGAMVVGPEYGPMAGVSIAAVERRPRLALRSCVALVVWGSRPSSSSIGRRCSSGARTCTRSSSRSSPASPGCSRSRHPSPER